MTDSKVAAALWEANEACPCPACGCLVGRPPCGRCRPLHAAIARYGKVCREAGNNEAAEYGAPDAEKAIAAARLAGRLEQAERTWTTLYGIGLECSAPSGRIPYNEAARISNFCREERDRLRREAGE